MGSGAEGPGTAFGVLLVFGFAESFKTAGDLTGTLEGLVASLSPLLLTACFAGSFKCAEVVTGITVRAEVLELVFGALKGFGFVKIVGTFAGMVGSFLEAEDVPSSTATCCATEFFKIANL